MKQRYNVRVKINSKKRHKNVPYSIMVDFDDIFKEKKIKGSLDNNSIEVKTASDEFVHFNLGEGFLYENKGKINILIEDTDIDEYILYFDTTESGPWPLMEYIGLVGNGDCLRSNSKESLPFFAGMHSLGHIADIDSDGNNELITGQIYSHVYKRDWHIVKTYRNTGTKENPVWGDDVPLRTIKDGKIIYMKGSTAISITDMNNDGLLDILTTGYGGYEGQNKIYIHLNTGKKDKSGFPLFEYAGCIELRECTYITVLRHVDLYNTGKKGFLIGRTYSPFNINRDEELWFEATEEEKASVTWPRWYMKSVIEYYETDYFDENGFPVLKFPVELVDENNEILTGYNHAGFDVLYNEKTKRYD